MSVLTFAEAVKLIENPKHAKSLAIARTTQTELTHFHNGNNPQLITNKVKGWLLDAKFKTFVNKTENHSQDIVNNIITHYKKIYNASGRNIQTEFIQTEENADAVKNQADLKIGFADLRDQLIDGLSDVDYFKSLGHTIAFIEPNSVYITGTDNDGSPTVNRYPLKNIIDADAGPSGMEYIILFKDDLYWIYDDEKLMLVSEVEGKKILVDEIPHGANKCPATFAYWENKEVGNHVLKKSPLTDVIKDLYTYNILKTFYFVYKANAAYSREIRAKTRCEHTSSDTYCDGGQLKDLSTHSHAGACPSCSKPAGIMGEVVEIPLSQQGDEEFLKNIPNMFMRQSADATILNFHKEDLENLKSSILQSVIGEGSQSREAMNSDQIAINFDEQEANLDEFRDNIQLTYNYIVNRAGEIYSDAFDGFQIFLGNKYFLKSDSQLRDELAKIIATTSNYADIQQKQIEIVMTTSRHDTDFIDRHRLMAAIQPFAVFGSDWFKENRSSLEARQKNAVALYDNFSQVVEIFEAVNETPIERFGTNQDAMTRFKTIKVEFQKILNEFILDGEEEEKEPEPEIVVDPVVNPDPPAETEEETEEE